MMHGRRSRQKDIGIVGVDDAAVAITVASIIAWASAAAVSIGAVLGLSATLSIAIATSLVLAGVAAGTKVVSHWVDELTADDTSDAHWANDFDSRTMDKLMTDEDAVKGLIQDIVSKHGHAGELATIKIWARWKIIHEPAGILTKAGIFDYPDQLRQYWEDMNALNDGDEDAKWASEFASASWDKYYTSEQGVIDFIKGMQQRQGRRAGAMAGIKAWGRWKAVIEPKILYFSKFLQTNPIHDTNLFAKPVNTTLVSASTIAESQNLAKIVPTTFATQATQYASHALLGPDAIPSASASGGASDLAVKSTKSLTTTAKAGGPASLATWFAANRTPVVAGGVVGLAGLAFLARKAFR